jgi:hypothetical protein
MVNVLNVELVAIGATAGLRWRRKVRFPGLVAVAGLALTCAIVPAHATNFEACVDEAKQNHNDAVLESYTFYKCEGKIAERLFARPDECPGGVKPPLKSLVEKTRWLDDGVFRTLAWTAGKCRGLCEARAFNSKDATFLCVLRIYK